MNHQSPCSVRRADAMDLHDRVVWVRRYAPDRALLMSPRRASQLVTCPRIPMVQATNRIPRPNAPGPRRPIPGHLAAGAHPL